MDYGTRDALGRIVTKTETVQSVTHGYGYAYDTRGRLTDVTTDGTPTSHYEYDANGNRLVGPGLTASPVYDAQDRMTSYGSCSYTYKADGSLQTKTCADGTTLYDYDAFGNLRHVTLPNGTNIDYVIDGQNRRVGKKVNGVLVEGFVYRNQLQPAVWLNGDGSARATFVYGLHANVPEYMVKGGTTYRLITDQVGSVRLVVDSTGNVAERIDYDEFGNVLADRAPGMQPFGFAGGVRDLHTGLVRFGMRDYDSTSGRWTAADPLRFGGRLTNLYSYAGSDAVNFIDPTGQFARICRSGKNLMVVIPITFFGRGATPANIASIIADIESTWSGRFDDLTVVTRVVNGSENQVELPGDDVPMSIQTEVIGTDKGIWAIGEPPGTYGHEVGHLLGLPDRYEDPTAWGNIMRHTEWGWRPWAEDFYNAMRLPSNATTCGGSCGH